MDRLVATSLIPGSFGVQASRTPNSKRTEDRGSEIRLTPNFIAVGFRQGVTPQGYL